MVSLSSHTHPFDTLRANGNWAYEITFAQVLSWSAVQGDEGDDDEFEKFYTQRPQFLGHNFWLYRGRFRIRKSGIESNRRRSRQAYRESLLRVTIHSDAMTQAYLGTQEVEHEYKEQIMELLRELDQNLALATTGGHDVAQIGAELRENALIYQEHVTVLHHELQTFQARLREVKNAQEHALHVMNATNAGIAKVVDTIEDDTDRAIQRFMIVIASLSGLVFVFIIVGGG